MMHRSKNIDIFLLKTKESYTCWNDLRMIVKKWFLDLFFEIFEMLKSQKLLSKRSFQTFFKSGIKSGIYEHKNHILSWASLCACVA